jgi:hypothetical protein
MLEGSFETYTGIYPDPVYSKEVSKFLAKTKIVCFDFPQV